MYSVTFRKHARFGLAVLGAVAVAACLVLSGGKSGEGGMRTELEVVVPRYSKKIAAEQALADDDKLPSWLRTPPVKLRPLVDLIREQQLDRKLSEGKEAANIAKEEHPIAQVTAKELAMRSVHKLASVHKQRVHNVHVMQPVHVQMTASAPSLETASKAHSVYAVAPEMKRQENVTWEIQSDEAKLRAVAHGEHSAEVQAKKIEVHKLAEIKAIAEKTRGVIEGEIKHLKNEEKEHSEKRKLKAEMAQIEEQVRF